MSQKFWDEKFDRDDYRYGRKPNAFVEAQALRVIKPGGRVLCLGAGEGRNAVWLASQDFEVTAVDQSPKGLEKLGRLADERGVEVETIETSVQDWEPEPGTFDAVVMTFLHLPDELRRDAHQKVVDTLADAGVVVMEAFTPRQRELERTSGGPPNIELLYTADMLREDFAQLEIELLEEESIELDEGPSHTGPAEVVRLVARKPI